MTKLEAIAFFMDMDECTHGGSEPIQMAIEALKQDSVLDKIKAEIEQNAYPIVHGVNNHEKGMTLNGILQVIDKYKAGKESE